MINEAYVLILFMYNIIHIYLFFNYKLYILSSLGCCVGGFIKERKE